MKFPFRIGHPLDLGRNIPKPSMIKQVSRRVLPFALLVFLFVPGLVSASVGVMSNLLADADFETPPLNQWFAQGQWVSIETCCGQHDTPYWGYNRPDPDTYDGSLDPANQFNRLYQNQTIYSSGYTWRLSTWASTSGMGADLRAYLPGRTIQCGNISTSTQTPLSCEFAASEGENVMATWEGTGTSGQWAVSDDWALTPLITPGRLNWQNWPPAPPLTYAVSTYATRTDMAAWSWNDSVGKQLLIKTSDVNQAKIRFNAQSFNDPTFVGRAWPPVNGVVVIDIDKTDVDPWNLYSYGLDARQGLFAHELGHALGLNDQSASCVLMNTDTSSTFWYCGTFRPTSVDTTAMRGIFP